MGGDDTQDGPVAAGARDAPTGAAGPFPPYIAPVAAGGRRGFTGLVVPPSPPPPGAGSRLPRSVRPSFGLSGPPSACPALPRSVRPSLRLSRRGEGTVRGGGGDSPTHTPPTPGDGGDRVVFHGDPAAVSGPRKWLGFGGGNRWVGFFFFWKSSGGSRDSRSRIPAGGV